jgi:hypothetical protein
VNRFWLHLVLTYRADLGPHRSNKYCILHNYHIQLRPFYQNGSTYKKACLTLSASVYFPSEPVILVRLVTARFMQRDDRTGIHQSSNILRGGVRSIVTHAHYPSHAYNGGMLFWAVVLIKACAARVTLTSLLPGPTSVRRQNKWRKQNRVQYRPLRYTSFTSSTVLFIAFATMN